MRWSARRWKSAPLMTSVRHWTAVPEVTTALVGAALVDISDEAGAVVTTPEPVSEPWAEVPDDVQPAISPTAANAATVSGMRRGIS